MLTKCELSNNLLKRLVKTPKLYFYDTGLVCYLTKWSSADTLLSGAMNGAILENYVVSEIMKTYLNSGKEPFMYYYRDKDAREIDIVLEHDGVINPIEIKKTSNPGTELTKVFNLLDHASTPRSKGVLFQAFCIYKYNYFCIHEYIYTIIRVIP